MWSYIVKNVDFDDKSVIDVGCGYADFMWRAYAAGARAVFGYDNDKTVNYIASERLETYGYVGKPVYIMNSDIQNWDEKWPGKHDIAICTSLLPYLKSPGYILECIIRDSDIAIIECQYAGDGPGFDWLNDDSAMAFWLFANGAQESSKLGETCIIGRDKYRTIWKVE